MFTGVGPDLDAEDMHVVPLGTLLANDQTLEAVIDLKVAARCGANRLSAAPGRNGKAVMSIAP